MHICRFTVFLAGLFLAAGAVAQQSEVVRVEDPALRVLPGNTPAGGYFIIINTSDETITLTGVSSPAFEHVEMHESTMRDGNHQMQKHSQIEVSGGDQMEFRPGGYHLMMMGRQEELSVDDEVEATFHFADDSTLDIPFTVVSPSYQ